ncbi:MAG: hypothetical protein WKG07_29400 [Hymenobacter sp.]
MTILLVLVLLLVVFGLLFRLQILTSIFRGTLHPRHWHEQPRQCRADAACLWYGGWFAYSFARGTSTR